MNIKSQIKSGHPKTIDQWPAAPFLCEYAGTLWLITNGQHPGSNRPKHRLAVVLHSDDNAFGVGEIGTWDAEGTPIPEGYTIITTPLTVELTPF